MKTDLPLKLALAKELPELVEVHDVDTAGLHTYFIYWRDTGKEVTEREWDWVVWKTCMSMSDEETRLYYCALSLTLSGHNTWQQRAEAYFNVKGSKS